MIQGIITLTITHLQTLSFFDWEYHHVPHEFNSAAQVLAKEACKHVIDRSWRFNVRGCIHDIVLTEQFALPLSCSMNYLFSPKKQKKKKLTN